MEIKLLISVGNDMILFMSVKFIFHVTIQGENKSNMQFEILFYISKFIHLKDFMDKYAFKVA